MSHPAIITLISDMGSKDHYVAAVKGVIYSQIPNCCVVDVSHEITAFNTFQAAWVLKNTFPNFPKGTVHIMGVNPEYSDDTLHVVIRYEGQYFIGADSGLFSLVFDRNPDDVFVLNIMQDSDAMTFPVRDLFAKAACHLARGGTAEVIGRRIQGIKSLEMLRPTVDENIIKATVIHVDCYGNVVTNVNKDLFRKVGKGRDFVIHFKNANFDIREIHQAYDEVPHGEKVAIFNSAGHLEIAVNKGAIGNGGGANTLLGLRLNHIIRIEFNAIANR